MIKFLSIISLSLFATLLWAQVPNDECNMAIELPAVTDFCSLDAAYTTVGSTPGSLAQATCFGAGTGDVWFKIIATADNITLTVQGNTPNAPAGTMNNPQVAMYTTTNCTSFNQLACNAGTNGLATLYKGGLTPGQTYYYRVQAGSGTGSFKICYNHYFLPDEISSDCVSGVHLCDKSTFVLPSVVGTGTQSDEAAGSCLSQIPPTETNSIWLNYVCDVPGTLTFTLTPTSPEDDLDFAVYQLPNGLDTCFNKVLLRCCASGDFTLPSPCMGPTGLSETSTDDSEPGGCEDPSQDNFVQSINMLAGETFAILINNFTSSGNGFKIEFGGTGTFKGASPEFLIAGPDTGCINTPYLFTDISTSVAGPIIEWNWNFGVDAIPATSNSAGPVAVRFSSPGTKLITLTVTTSEGCKVTIVKSFVIVGFSVSSTLLVPPTCNGGVDGSFEIINVSGFPPFSYIWSGGPDQTNNLFENVPQGTYAVSVTDAFGCFVVINVEVKELELILDTITTDVINPACSYTLDGQITANVSNGVGPYLFDWGNGFQDNNSLVGLTGGMYFLTITDGNLCETNFEFEINAPPPISIFIDTIDILCSGDNNGRVIVSATGGVGDFTFLWSNEETGTEIQNLMVGQFDVTVTDGNGCVDSLGAFITEPPPLIIDTISTQNVICFGDSTGRIVSFPTNGKKPLRYSIDGIRFQIDSIFREVPANDYWLIVRDANGCLDSMAVNISQPEELIVYAGPDITYNLGETEELSGVMLNPPFHPVDWLWQPAIGLQPNTEPLVVTSAVETTLYTLLVSDSTDCTATDQLLVTVIKYRPIYLPNAFSPNGDGINDFFTIYANVATERVLEMFIFDRWGNQIWERFNFQPGVETLGWNGIFRGEPVAPGVFTYVIKVLFVDGEVITYKGDINVLK